MLQLSVLRVSIIGHRGYRREMHNNKEAWVLQLPSALWQVSFEGPGSDSGRCLILQASEALWWPRGGLRRSGIQEKSYTSKCLRGRRRMRLPGGGGGRHATHLLSLTSPTPTSWVKGCDLSPFRHGESWNLLGEAQWTSSICGGEDTKQERLRPEIKGRAQPSAPAVPDLDNFCISVMFCGMGLLNQG